MDLASNSGSQSYKRKRSETDMQGNKRNRKIDDVESDGTEDETEDDSEDGTEDGTEDGMEDGM